MSKCINDGWKSPKKEFLNCGGGKKKGVCQWEVRAPPCYVAVVENS
jgi:hypothetical protein